MEHVEKKVDESWKEQIERERTMAEQAAAAVPPTAPGVGAGGATPPPGATAGAPPPGATAGAPPPGGGVAPGGPAAAAPADAPPPEEETAGEPESPLFEGLLQSLAVQATMFLGMQPDPRTGLVSEDLGQAKQIVDMLGELELKTRGNLTPRETQLMQMLLQDLRLAFVQRMQAQTPGAMPDGPAPGGPAPGAPPF